ncbi:MAG: outer membrane protein assembly factor BamD [Ignavibacteriales bacterium]|nr:outer membrane protein assembly factor BamD [Ignavibacteriales bacterium]
MNETRIKNTVLMGLAIVALLLLDSCSSTKEVEQMSVEKRYANAKTFFNDRDYLQAYEEFRIVTLQYQGNALANDAQYYMGECRFKREEYILAAYEYDVLIRTMPTSPYVAKARYSKALCYFRMSPSFNLDQNYSKQAIDEFQSFIEYCPTDSLVTDAEKKIGELNTKLAQKEYENGVTYMHMEYFKSAAASFDHVVEKYHDTQYAEQAQLRKAESQLMRNRPHDAKTEIDKFFSKYPSSQWKSDAERVRGEIISRLNSSPPEAKNPEANPSH